MTLTTCEITPSCTGTGIQSYPNVASDDLHLVVLPPATRKDVLVVFLGGSESTPNVYGAISAEAGALGYGVVDLRYPDSDVIGTVCGNHGDCFAPFRGMTIFGEDTPVPGVAGSPYVGDAWGTAITAQDSILNRLVNVLDLLATADPWWGQFLTDTTSPYTTAHHPTGVLPTWPRVVFAGHSQGGGDAALIGTQVASVRRVITFGATDDHTGAGSTGTNPGTSAAWITSPAMTLTELARFWGMRDTQEGVYSECTSYNWYNLGGQSGSTSCIIGDEAAHGWEVFVGLGAGAPGGLHYLVTTDDPSATALHAHDSSAVDDNIADGSSRTPFSTDRTVAWDYLFTAGGTD